MVLAVGFKEAIIPAGLPEAVTPVAGDQLYVVKFPAAEVTFTVVLLPLHIVAEAASVVSDGGAVTVAVTMERTLSQTLLTTRLNRYMLSNESLPYQ